MRREETVKTIDARYTCIFRPEPEGGYTVRCPAFPGLITNGKTLEEARANAREALEIVHRGIPAGRPDVAAIGS
jgi:predicted RNase H-like HicB family nuclease